MKFRVVDDLLSRQMTGERRSPVAEHLGYRLVRFARGVAVYEMPVRAHACNNGVLTALAEAAMTAAATTIVADDGAPLETLELSARFERAVREGEVLRAEAIVMRREGAAVLVEADVLCAGDRVATFAARCAAPALREVAA